MKNILSKHLWLSAFLLSLITAQAQQADCGFIQNPDRQAYCRAISGGGSSHCGFIREPDLQARCRAETGGGTSQCGFIRDRDMQAACRASADRANSSKVVAANAALSESQICKPCAARRRAVDLANVDLYGIAICRRLVGR